MATDIAAGRLKTSPHAATFGPLARLANEARATTLDTIAGQMIMHPPHDEHGLRDAVRALLICGVSASAIAGSVRVAVSSVTRWTQGVQIPHPSLREALAAALPRLAREQAALYRAADPGVARAA